jgi:branched-chain amino acid aminotransferase
MTLTDSIHIEKTTRSTISEVDFTNLEFGKHIADHMLISDFRNGQWETPRIMPFGEIKLTPAMLALHYGQSIFEGMKAYRFKDGNISIFRAQKHHRRLSKSLERMCMPAISEEMFINSLHALLEVDEKWVSDIEGNSLYIRPLVFASESRLGVKVADQYKFVIMNSPVGPYINKPFKIKVEDYYTRAAEGGTGFAKCAGNYGGAFYPTQLARQQGYDQVLWTDHKEHLYIDEAGMMNVMFVIEGKLVTPKLSTTILDGVTRDSILTLAKDMGFPIEERKVSVKELEDGLKKGTLTEMFGAGTAAVVAPISTVNIHGTEYTIPTPSPESFQQKVKKQLSSIRLGNSPDKHGWNYIVSIK